MENFVPGSVVMVNIDTYEKSTFWSRYMGIRRSIQFKDMLVFNRKKSFRSEDNLSFKFQILLFLSFDILSFISRFLEVLC